MASLQYFSASLLPPSCTNTGSHVQLPATQTPISPSGSATSEESSSNSVSTGHPCTSVSTSLMPAFGINTVISLSSSGGGVKRSSKAMERVNTVERRAKHNAVERQSRKMLNARFLSAIVNSSIAHPNASRRHRILAAQQLRTMKSEADAPRHEVNEWRRLAGVALDEEPTSSDAFDVIICGGLEIVATDVVEGDDGEDNEGCGAEPSRTTFGTTG
ncbi:hypothetical protein B0H14DRAFT_2579405 [Mycena olivaceomarginata]|nr:hypothetical protein B0H14DRAFT_2579405 [Mycena olivaceomarginata]